MSNSAERETVVVKYGSACVADANGIDNDKLNEYVEDLAQAQEQYNLVVVSSGSIAVGRAMWRQTYGDKTEPGYQSLATIGSARAVAAWQTAFAKKGILAGQVEVTHHEIQDNQEGAMLKQVLAENIHHNIVSIINENDALSDEEIIKLRTGGDNDGLASILARKTLVADRLILLTADEDGLRGDDGEIVSEVGPSEAGKSEALSWVDGQVSELGRGGMRAKIEAATCAARLGVHTYIASANQSLDSIIGQRTGTYFSVETKT